MVSKLITLSPKKRGFHLVTDEILQQIPEIKQIEIGLMNVFIQHTSASLTVNENAAPDVRVDMETIFNKLVPEDNSYQHLDEGKDDMPAHAKCSLLGASINIPISSGRLAFGTWQGIYLCEHRNRARQRNIVVTINGQAKNKDFFFLVFILAN